MIALGSRTTGGWNTTAQPSDADPGARRDEVATLSHHSGGFAPAAEPRAARWTQPELAKLIRHYWAQQELSPDVRVEQMDVMLGADGRPRPIEVIRSDMVNGRPRARWSEGR